LVGLWNDTDDPITTDEAAVIKACLAEESSPLIPPRPLLRMRSYGESRETLPGLQEMDPQEWIEPEEDFPHFKISAKVEPAKIPPKRCSSKQYTAGLSPDCKSAFFLSPKNIIVCSLDNFPNILEGDIRLDYMPDSRREYDAAKAVLTNRFLAVITKGKLSKFSVFEHGASIENKLPLHSELLCMWYPTCLAMHEASDRTWVVIGGRSNQIADIKMYVIEDVQGALTVKRHDAQFGKCMPDALSNDWLKIADFSPDGRRLVCLTNKNTVLAWFLSNNARPRQAAFEIMKPYEWVSAAPV
jgi:hypothetical protein